MEKGFKIRNTDFYNWLESVGKVADFDSAMEVIAAADSVVENVRMAVNYVWMMERDYREWWEKDSSHPTDNELTEKIAEAQKFLDDNGITISSIEKFHNMRKGYLEYEGNMPVKTFYIILEYLKDRFGYKGSWNYPPNVPPQN